MDYKWNKWFLGMAEYVSTASKDPSTKVGAVIIDSDRTVVSLGYNGFPRGIVDDTEKLNNRDIKYKYIVHAERNSLLFAKQSLKYCTIYTYPFMPCPVCAGMIIQAGIKSVVSYYIQDTRWYDDFVISTKMFSEAGVNLYLYKNKIEDYFLTGYHDV